LAIRCSIPTSRRSPGGSLDDLVDAKSSEVKFFLPINKFAEICGHCDWQERRVRARVVVFAAAVVVL
jgi:hypothetical protein